MVTILRPAAAVTLVALALTGVAAIAPPSAVASSSPAVGGAVSGAQTRRGSALITTADVARTVEWYRRFLGFQLISERSSVQGRSALLERSGTLLEVTEEDRMTARNPVSLTLLVNDVDREVEALEAKGVEILSEPRDELSSRFRVSRLYDDDRRVVELREPLGSDDVPLGHQEF